jgi:hypothetical protein
MDAAIELPDGWVDRTVLTYVGPDDGEGSPSLVVTRDELTEGITLGRYATMQDAAVRAGLEGVDLVDERETTVAGRPAVRHTYVWSMDGRAIRQRVWCLLEGSTGYAITASAPEARFEELRPLFARAVASFAIME